MVYVLQSNIPKQLGVIGHHVLQVVAVLVHHSQLWEQEHMSQQRVPTSHEPVTGVLTFL